MQNQGVRAVVSFALQPRIPLGHPRHSTLAESGLTGLKCFDRDHLLLRLGRIEQARAGRAGAKSDAILSEQRISWRDRLPLKNEAILAKREVIGGTNGQGASRHQVHLVFNLLRGQRKIHPDFNERIGGGFVNQ